LKSLTKIRTVNMQLFKVWAWEYWGNPLMIVSAYIAARTQGEAMSYFEKRCGLDCPVTRIRKVKVKK
jgi:predicted nucleotide-binding protein (sugar kinase/HSP70/actin superfamily)